MLIILINYFIRNFQFFIQIQNNYYRKAEITKNSKSLFEGIKFVEGLELNSENKN